MILLTLVSLIVTLTLPAAPPAQQPGPDVASLARDALAAIVTGDFPAVEQQFTVEVKAALPPGRLATIWTTLQSQAGAYKSCGAEQRIRRIADKQMVITACEFERAAIDVQFAFDGTGRISGLAFRPAAGPATPYTLPPYATPSSFTEREITVGTGEWALPGTLTIPAGSGPWPAVVLVHGSGPNDRDESILGAKPFKDLAVGLGSQGIAVLRYDKRTLAHPAKTAERKDLTVKEEVIDDVLEALRVLRTQPGIDAGRIFVLGHSLGGMLIPRIAAADPAIAGLIVLAGPARPLEAAIVEQTRYLAMVDGTISPDEQRAIDQAEATAASVAALKPEDAQSGRLLAGAPASYWLDLRGYDPPFEATRVKAPMLVLQGERDYQVTTAEFARWKTTLGGRRDVTFHSYPALNHLFIAGTGPSSPADYQTPGHVAADVIRDIAAWIHADRR